MNYDEEIRLLHAERDKLEERILRLMELQSSDRIDLKAGDHIVIKQTEAIAEVIKCYASACSFHNEQLVEIIVECKHALVKCIHCNAVKLINFN